MIQPQVPLWNTCSCTCDSVGERIRTWFISSSLLQVYSPGLWYIHLLFILLLLLFCFTFTAHSEPRSSSVEHRRSITTVLSAWPCRALPGICAAAAVIPQAWRSVETSAILITKMIYFNPTNSIQVWRAQMICSSSRWVDVWCAQGQGLCVCVCVICWLFTNIFTSKKCFWNLKKSVAWRL